MIVMPMPAARAAPPVVTLVAPSASFSAWYPIDEALATVTGGSGGSPSAVYLQRSTGGAYTEAAMSWEAGRSKWVRADPGAGLTQDTITFRVRAVVGGVSYYSATVTGTQLYPAVSVSTPTEGFTLNAGATSTATIYVNGEGAITYAGLEVYENGGYVTTYELAYSHEADGKRYYSGTITHPGLPGGATGLVVGKMTIESADRYSPEVSGSWVVA